MHAALVDGAGPDTLTLFARPLAYWRSLDPARTWAETRTFLDGGGRALVVAGGRSSAGGEERAGLTASARIRRRDFGLTWNQALETSGVLVGDEIAITIDVQLLRLDDARAA